MSLKKPPFIVAQLLFWIAFSCYLQATDYVFSKDLDLFVRNTLFVFIGGFAITTLYAYVLKFLKIDYQNLVKIVLSIVLGILAGVSCFQYITWIVFNEDLLAEINKYKYDVMNYHISSIFFNMALVTPWFLIYHFYKYAEISYRNRQSLLIAETQMQQMKIENMVNKLNPHFLFNTLNSIKWQINKNTDYARDSIDKISNILRYNLDEHRGTKLIKDEISIVRQYLEIEQLRFDDRLSFEIKVEQTIENQPIIPFLILNLVENSIKHGIAQLVDGGLIEINVFKENEILQIEVLNTGTLQGTKNGFGLNSLKEILASKYSNLASLNVVEVENTKVKVVIKYPIT